MTASTKPKTPNMTLPVLEDARPDDVDRFCKRASRLTLSQLVDNVVVRERLCIKHDVRTKEYTINIKFFPAKEYRQAYGVTTAEVLNCFGTRFGLLLKKEINLELKRLDANLKGERASIGKGRAEPGSGVGASDAEAEIGDALRQDNDEDLEMGDEEADEAERVRQSKQQVTYGNDSEDDEIQDPDGVALDDDVEANFKDDSLSDSSDNSSNVDKDVDEDLNDGDLIRLTEVVEQLLKKNLKNATSFSFQSSGCSFKLEVGDP